MKSRLTRIQFATFLFAIFGPVCLAQFSSSVQGTIQDPSGASVPKAEVTLLNTATNVSKKTTSDDSGNYQFVSLPPASYTVSAVAPGFAPRTVSFSLETGQTLNVALGLQLVNQSQNVEVTGEAPTLNTAETRTQLTLTNQAVQTLPLSGRNLINLVTMAPGVTGLGTAAGGSPGSAVDNYGTELQVDASSNGRGSVGNMFVVDGLDITSFIRPGVLNLTPNPDSIQETSIQANTFSVAYGRASGIEMLMTTKSGSDQFHGLVSDYFTSQQLWSGTQFVHDYLPFHTNNMSANLGGPILPRHQFFGFFAIEPLWQSTAGGSLTTVESPEFVNWAQQAFPNTLGTKLLTTYQPTGGARTGVAKTALDLFPNTCGTSATSFLPCNIPVTDNAVFSSTNYRNAYQYNLRLDKYFQNDRLYGTYFKSHLNTGGPNIRPAFNSTSNYHTDSIQVNEAHTFSPSTVNEAIFGYLNVEGISPATGTFTVPSVSVTGLGSGFGNGFALGDFIQHSYHWRDVLRHVRGSHTFEAGYEGWHGEDIVYFQGPYSLPNFSFNNIVDMVQDKPYTESSLAYDPLTGKAAPGNYFFASTTAGLFFQDTWKATQHLTVNYGLRWDNTGNPYGIKNQILSNFQLGAGLTENERIANGFYAQRDNVFNHSISNVWSPRFGLAWDVAGTGKWVVRGGFGIYHDWLTLGNAENNLKGNPPGWISPTFYSGTSSPPVFSLGTNNTYPFGFTYPALPPGSLDSRGGLVGAQLAVGGNDVNMSAPNTYTYTASLEHSLGSNFVTSIGYIGQRSTNLVIGSAQTTATSYGMDINRFSGDLLQCNCTVPTRLNPSFGAITYATNGAESSYNAFYAGVRGRLTNHGYFNASYTRSRSYDNAGVYPTATNIGQYRGPSTWDAPNRFSLSWSYQFPALHGGSGFVGNLSKGWTLSGTTILQSGTPFTVYTNAAFAPTRDAAGQIIGYAPGSGDFNADGVNFDYPDVAKYTMATNRQAYLSAVFNPSVFATPSLGMGGNERVNQFRNPGFAEVDAALLKDIPLWERVKMQFRVEAFNVLNRVNLGAVDANLASGTFGRSTSQLQPRWFQFAARVFF
jgi:hypothetical protein